MIIYLTNIHQYISLEGSYRQALHFTKFDKGIALIILFHCNGRYFFFRFSFFLIVLRLELFGLRFFHGCRHDSSDCDECNANDSSLAGANDDWKEASCESVGSTPKKIVLHERRRFGISQKCKELARRRWSRTFQCPNGGGNLTERFCVVWMWFSLKFVVFMMKTTKTTWFHHTVWFSSEKPHPQNPHQILPLRRALSPNQHKNEKTLSTLLEEQKGAKRKQGPMQTVRGWQHKLKRRQT